MFVHISSRRDGVVDGIARIGSAGSQACRMTAGVQDPYAVLK